MASRPRRSRTAPAEATSAPALRRAALVAVAVALGGAAAALAAALPPGAHELPSCTRGGGFGLLAGLALATLLSEDLTCLGAGVLVAQGRVGYLAATAACFVGIYAGDLMLFGLGRLGRPALRVAPLRWWVDERRVAAASEWLRRRGATVLLTSRFLPGTRFPTYVGAGLLRTPFWRFAGWFLIAALLWTPALVGLASGLGHGVFGALLPAGASPVAQLATLAAIAIVGLMTLRLVVPLVTWQGRRRMVGRLRRLARWEFWPPWLAYPPLLLRIAALAVRHRGATVFTAANPAIPGGGFVGESKSQILALLAPAAGAHLPPWTLLPAGGVAARLAALDAFRADAGLDWPLVLKPDAGQRGSGVAVVRDRDAAAAWLARLDEPVIAQAYLPGVELGIFWYRLPDAPHGVVFSVTEKVMPEVVGDGHRTVEDLVLADERAVCMAATYLRDDGPLGGERRLRVPAAGERVPLVELGTHCRGAVFLDGRRRLTPALAEAVERIGAGLPGFFFGRYDLRAPSFEHFARGEFSIVELNGVTAEATHVYDPAVSLADAYRTLAAQWRIAFEIGARNRAAGVRPATLRELAAALRAYRRREGARPA